MTNTNTTAKLKEIIAELRKSTQPVHPQAVAALIELALAEN